MLSPIKLLLLGLFGLNVAAIALPVEAEAAVAATDAAPATVADDRDRDHRGGRDGDRGRDWDRDHRGGGDRGRDWDRDHRGGGRGW